MAGTLETQKYTCFLINPLVPFACRVSSLHTSASNQVRSLHMFMTVWRLGVIKYSLLIIPAVSPDYESNGARTSCSSETLKSRTQTFSRDDLVVYRSGASEWRRASASGSVQSSTNRNALFFFLLQFPRGHKNW